MNRRRRLITVLICAIILISMFASFSFIVRESAHRHVCIGDDCPICQFIAQIEQLRRGFRMIALMMMPFCFALAARREICALDLSGGPAFCTLVGRKIRLND